MFVAVCHRRSFKYDFQRMLRLCLWSVAVGTPLGHYWFQFLDTVGRGGRGVRREGRVGEGEEGTEGKAARSSTGQRELHVRAGCRCVRRCSGRVGFSVKATVWAGS